MKSLYVHIPFCKQKCLYCDFNSYSGKENLIDAYCEALKKELQSYSFHEFQTIYFGGGTPSILPYEKIDEILQQTKCNGEITLEVNPGTVEEEKLKNYRKIGINRLSIGLQATQDDILKEIGRIHTYQEFKQVYALARKVGFTNVNVDFMFGLPKQTLENVEESIQEILACQPEHISCYSLILHEPIFQNLPTEEEERKMYETIQNRLKEAGYEQYEISNFAKKGKESQHNLCYWNQEEYIGIGAGASSYLDRKRYTNERKIEAYIAKMNQNKIVYTIEEEQNQESQLREYMILRLRLLEGVDVKKAYEKFGVNVLEKFEKEIERMEKKGLLRIVEGKEERKVDQKQDKNNVSNNTENNALNNTKNNTPNNTKNNNTNNTKNEIIDLEKKIQLTSKGLDFANIVWAEFI